MNKERLNNAFAGITYSSLGALFLLLVLYLTTLYTCPNINFISVCYEETIPVLNAGLFVSILATVLSGIVWYYVAPVKKKV